MLMFMKLYTRDVREWLSSFPFPTIPILSMLKLYIVSDRGRINYISVVGKHGTIDIGI